MTLPARFAFALIAAVMCSLVHAGGSFFVQPNGITVFDPDIEDDDVKTMVFYVTNDYLYSPMHIVSPGCHITGPDADQFSVDAMVGTTILSYDQLAITVRFTPTSPGRKEADLVISNDSFDYPNGSVDLVGYAEYPTLTPFTTSVDFGSMHVDRGPTTRSVIITNTGTQDLIFGTPGISLTGPNVFAIDDFPSTAPLAAQTSRTYTVSFDPASSGYYNGDIRFDTNDPNSPTMYIDLRGLGFKQIVDVDAPSLDFGHKVLGEGRTRSRWVTVKNTGSYPLSYTGSGIAIVGQDAGDFGLEDVPSLEPMPQGFDAASSQTLRVYFDPQFTGPKTASLVITTDDSKNPTVTLPLSGLGLAPKDTLTQGLYDGYGPGESTIGDGGDYPSLQSACAAVTSVPLTGGDWTFKILNDLTEPYNSYLGQTDTNGQTITFRPALNTTATVTFTTTVRALHTANFVIGGLDGKLRSGTNSLYCPTSHIVIDGSQISGGSDRSLTFQHVGGYGAGSLVKVVSDSDFVTIKNCNFRTPGTGNYNLDPFIAAVQFLYLENIQSAIDQRVGAPDFGTVQNCDIMTSGYMRAVAMDGPSFGVAETHAINVKDIPVGFTVSNNIIQTSATAVFINTDNDTVVQNNRIQLAPGLNGPSAIQFIGVGYFWDGTYSRLVRNVSVGITSNTISILNTAGISYNCAGIAINNGKQIGEYLVANNSIVGISAGTNATASRSAISFSTDSQSTAVIVHNSVYMPASVNVPDPRYCFAIGTPQTNSYPPVRMMGTMLVHGNIFRVEQTSATAIRINGNEGLFVSDHNCISLGNDALAAYWSGYAIQSFEDYQTTSGQDLASITQNPFEAAELGAGTWTRASDGVDPGLSDLHFSALPGEIYYVMPTPGIRSDIDGEPRARALVVMGADEIPNPIARVTDWAIY